MNALQLSASSLQDYVDCPRRFQLRYIWHLSWPAPESEPLAEHERRIRLGRELHRLIHQHLLGIPAEQLSTAARDPQLARWWQSYLAYAPELASAQVLPELGLSTVIAGCRLYAQYDALLIRRDSVGQPTQFVILDWKTYRQRPRHSWLAARLQTRVYPLVLMQAGTPFNHGQPIQSECVELRYWLAEYPEAPISFAYSQTEYQLDTMCITDLVNQIVSRIEDEEQKEEVTVWPLTDDYRRCRACIFRSLCRRGSVAGPATDDLEVYSAEGEMVTPGAEEPEYAQVAEWAMS